MKSSLETKAILLWQKSFLGKLAHVGFFDFLVVILLLITIGLLSYGIIIERGKHHEKQS